MGLRHFRGLFLLAGFAWVAVAGEAPHDVFVAATADTPSAANPVDAVHGPALRARGLDWAPLCSDAVFVRRAHLDLLGLLPAADEVRSFLEDPALDKRGRLVDALLARDDFAEYQAMRWADALRVKSEFPINLWPAGAAAYHLWIRDALRRNLPLDEIARVLLLADGSALRKGPPNFWRAVPVRDADGLAAAVAQTFLGEYPEHIPEERQRRLAVFFSRVGYKATAEWKEEVVFWTGVPPEAPEAILPDGARVAMPPDRDPRAVFADWLTGSPNGRAALARAWANRIWFWLFGRGLAADTDEIPADAPPRHPELLDALARTLAENAFDGRALYRVILTSRTYQQSSVAAPRRAEGDIGPDPAELERMLAVYPVRRLEAEVLQDVLSRVFRLAPAYVSEIPEPFTHVPPGRRAVSLHDASITSPFLDRFGRASRDSGSPDDRNNELGEAPMLFLFNSPEIVEWCRKRAAPLARRLERPQRSAQALDELWLSLRARYPTEGEREKVAAWWRDTGGEAVEKAGDLVWALVNSPEFYCRY